MAALGYLTDRDLTVETDGRLLTVRTSTRLTDDDRTFIRAHKAELIAELERRRRRDEVLMMLADNPAVKYAYAVDTGTVPVILAVAIRDMAAFEMTIPADRYDGFRLLQFIEDSEGARRVE